MSRRSSSWPSSLSSCLIVVFCSQQAWRPSSVFSRVWEHRCSCCRASCWGIALLFCNTRLPVEISTGGKITWQHFPINSWPYLDVYFRAWSIQTHRLEVTSLEMSNPTRCSKESQLEQAAQKNHVQSDFWAPPKMETLQHPWAACSGAQSPVDYKEKKKKDALLCLNGSACFHLKIPFVPVPSCLFTGCHWRESGSVFFTSHPRGIYTHW